MTQPSFVLFSPWLPLSVAPELHGRFSLPAHLMWPSHTQQGTPVHSRTGDPTTHPPPEISPAPRGQQVPASSFSEFPRAPSHPASPKKPFTPAVVAFPPPGCCLLVPAPSRMGWRPTWDRAVLFLNQFSIWPSLTPLKDNFHAYVIPNFARKEEYMRSGSFFHGYWLFIHVKMQDKSTF